MDHHSHDQTGQDPVFWWWAEGAHTRVVLLGHYALVLSGPLAPEEVAQLEEARQRGDVLSADIGADAVAIELSAVTELRYLPDDHELQVACGLSAPVIVRPPADSAGIAAGVFELLKERLAPGVPAQERVNASNNGDASTIDLRIMAAVGSLGLICLVLGLRAEEGAQFDAPLATFRLQLNDMFVSLGLIPAVVALGLLVGLQIRRLKNGRPLIEDIAEGDRYLLVPVGTGDRTAQAEAALEAADDSFDRPLLGPADEEDPLASLLEPHSASSAPPPLPPGPAPVEEAASWQDTAEPDDAAADGDAIEQDEIESVPTAWGSAPTTETPAWSASSMTSSPATEPESESEPVVEVAAWGSVESESESESEPVVEVAAWGSVEPESESEPVVEVAAWGSVEPEPAPVFVPEPVAEVVPEAMPEAVVQSAPMPPQPAWATSPEPASQVVSAAVSERAVPASATAPPAEGPVDAHTAESAVESLTSAAAWNPEAAVTQ